MPSLWWGAASRGRAALPRATAVWILCYRRIGIPAAKGGTPWPTFRDHLEALRGRSVPLGDALSGAAEPGRAAVTFDVAYAEQGEAARGCLAAGIAPTIFVPTGIVGTDRPLWWEGRPREECEAARRAMRRGAPPPEGGRRVALLSWEDLSRLVESGVRIEAHGHTHRILSGLDDAGTAQEVWSSIETLRDRLGVEASALAYPGGDWGDFDDRTAHILGRYGIRHGLTAVFGAARAEEPYRVRRVVVADEPAAAVTALLDGGGWADRAKRLFDRARGRS